MFSRALKFTKIVTFCVFFILMVCFAVDYATQFFGVQLTILSWLHFLPGSGTSLIIAAPAVIAPFPVDSDLTAVSISYRNKMFIADRVLRRMPVGKQNFKYKLFAKGQFLTIPNTLVGRTSKPNQVNIGYTETDSSTMDHALDAPVPQVDIDNAPSNYDPKAAAAMLVTDCIGLDREKRVADLVFSTSEYSASNYTTLSGTSQFSHASSTPIVTIQNAIDACFFRPNKCVMGRSVWTALSRHADIVSATQKNSGTKGKASREAFAELFELDEVNVGEGWYNSAKPGQTPTVVRLWGKSLVLYYDNPIADMMNGIVTFGGTAQFGDRVSGSIPDPNIGMRGGVMVRAGESVKELIFANDMGYLFDAAVA